MFDEYNTILFIFGKQFPSLHPFSLLVLQIFVKPQHLRAIMANASPN